MQRGRGVLVVALVAGVLVAVGTGGGPVGAQPPECFGQPATIMAVEGEATLGTDGDDVIVGTDGADDIRGGDGDDLICGEAGADLIRGNAGADRISGGTGGDEIRGGPGPDVAFGGQGPDVIYGNGGADLLRGKRGNDQLWGGPGDDTMFGGRGRDRLLGRADDDDLVGGPGFDVCRGGRGDNEVSLCESAVGRPLTELWDIDLFNAPVVTAHPVELSFDALALFDGLVVSVVVEFGDGGTIAALTVAGGDAQLIAGRWCNSWKGPPHDGFDGLVILSGDLGQPNMICTPGEEATPLQDYSVLATARIQQRRLALVADSDDLRYLDLDTLQSEPFVELGVERPGSASYNDDTWVLVLWTVEDDPDSEPRRRIVFVDSAGDVIDVAGNPFPDPDTSAPRAAALSDDGETLVFSAGQDDNSSWLVFWDLQKGTEISRVRVIEPQQGQEPHGLGRMWVSGIDISGARILVNVLQANGELHPAGALLVDFSGHVIDLNDQDELDIQGAAFLSG